MADLSQLFRSAVTRITGGNELFAADVIAETDGNKLLVKATIIPAVLGRNVFAFVEDDQGSNVMSVNGSNTPVDFYFYNNTNEDLLVSSLHFEAECGSPSAAGFMASSALSNGVLVEVKAEDEVFNFLPILKNYEFDSRFAAGPGSDFKMILGPGKDYIGAKYNPANPFVLKKTGTYATNDYVRCTIQDKLNGSVSDDFKLLVIASRVQ